MSRLPQIDPDTASGTAKELLTGVQKALGVTPNMTKVMVNSPALLRGYLGLAGALDDGVLPAGVRERLAVATAEHNGCGYCLSAHTYIGSHVAHVDDAELERARQARSEDPHTAALLALSDAVLRGRGVVGDEVWRSVREAGVTDAEVAEVVGHVALNVLTNYFNVLADVDIDWPVVLPHSQAA